MSKQLSKKCEDCIETGILGITLCFVCVPGLECRAERLNFISHSRR